MAIFKCVETEGDLKFPASVLEFAKPHPSITPPNPEKCRIIRMVTVTNINNIFDSCMGSGTTGMHVKKPNRKFIGIELDDNYFEVAKERILGMLK